MAKDGSKKKCGASNWAWSWFLAGVVMVGGGCSARGGGVVVDAGAVADAGAGADAGTDAGTVADAGVDAGIDAGAWTRLTDAGFNYATVYVPSSAAGTQGIATWLAWPKVAAAARYPQGAPVVVTVVGGNSTSDLPVPGSPGYTPYGIVSIEFLFPGGSHFAAASGGKYDFRGPNCIRAVADVAKFATGQLAVMYDGGARTISEVVGYPVVTSNVGVLASSNGGNVAAIAFARHGEELLVDGGGRVAWYVGWENPVGDHYVTSEFNGNGGYNPYYTLGSCNFEECVVDYSRLKYAPDAGFSSKNDEPDGGLISFPGKLYWDYNMNGAYDADGGDYHWTPFVARVETDGGPVVGFYPVEVAAVLAAGAWDAGVPLPYATASESSRFWSDRDVAADGGFWRAAVEKLPGLGVMVLATAIDHVQEAPDHPHIKVQVDGWQAAGAAWVRLNPDSVYVAATGSSTSVDLLANRTYAWADMDAGIYLPESVVTGFVYASGILEMADRVQSNNWSTNLAATLWP